MIQHFCSWFPPPPFVMLMSTGVWVNAKILDCFYHVDDLRERNLQGHVKNVVRVFHGPQCARVVGEQVCQQLLSIFPMSGPAGYNRKVHIEVT